jgi:hypothetical protein
MVLITVCEVCSTPRVWQRREELTLVYATFVKCSVCNLLSTISKELKDNVKREWGIPFYEES